EPGELLQALLEQERAGAELVVARSVALLAGEEHELAVFGAGGAHSREEQGGEEGGEDQLSERGGLLFGQGFGGPADHPADRGRPSSRARISRKMNGLPIAPRATQAPSTPVSAIMAGRSSGANTSPLPRIVRDPACRLTFLRNSQLEGPT